MTARRPCRPAGPRHALTTDPVDDPALTTEVADRVAQWADAERPDGPAQHWLLARTALASVRLDRAAEQEQAAAAVWSASADWRRQRHWSGRCSLNPVTGRAGGTRRGCSTRLGKLGRPW